MNQPPNQRNGSVLWIAGLAVVVILGVIAVVATRSDRSEKVAAQDERQTGEVQTDTTEGDAPAALPVFDATTEDPAVGQVIPTVSGTDFDGNDLTIGPDGGAKVIVFVAHWCPHCQAEVPVIQEHLDENPLPEGVELLTVSTSVKPGAENYPPEEWLDREGWAAPVLADDEAGTAAQRFGLSAFPYFVAVDADGQVVQRASGELSTEQFDALVDLARGQDAS